MRRGSTRDLTLLMEINGAEGVSYSMSLKKYVDIVSNGSVLFHVTSQSQAIPEISFINFRIRHVKFHVKLRNTMMRDADGHTESCPSLSLLTEMNVDEKKISVEFVGSTYIVIPHDKSSDDEWVINLYDAIDKTLVKANFVTNKIEGEHDD